MRHKSTGLAVICALILLCFAAKFSAQTASDATIEASVRALRDIRIDKLDEKQKEVKAKQIDDAWKILIAAGKPAIAGLKDEIAKVDAGNAKDDFFKLNATVVIWEIGKLDEAEAIAKIWNTTPISAQYNYVFLTAMQAAKTHDPKALPMLKAILRDDKGSIYFAMHAMNVTWPLSHEFIWGAFGPNGLASLAGILERSNDEVELKSAIPLLAKAQYLPALPRIRELSASKSDEVRRQAIQALGMFGHPSDYDRLIAGLSSTDSPELFSYVFALYEFEDERAVKHLIPILAKGDDRLKVEASLALLHLLTPESLAAVKEFTAKATSPEVKKFVGRSITLREDKLPKDFTSKARDVQATLLSKLRNAEITPAPSASILSTERLLAALQIWRDKGRIYDSGFDWVGEPQVIAAAKPENIDLLLSTKAAFYPRLSDECLYEVRDLDTVIKYVGRSRYRLGLGVTERATLK